MATIVSKSNSTTNQLFTAQLDLFQDHIRETCFGDIAAAFIYEDTSKSKEIFLLGIGVSNTNLDNKTCDQDSEYHFLYMPSNILLMKEKLFELSLKNNETGNKFYKEAHNNLESLFQPELIEDEWNILSIIGKGFNMKSVYNAASFFFNLANSDKMLGRYDEG